MKVGCYVTIKYNRIQGNFECHDVRWMLGETSMLASFSTDKLEIHVSLEFWNNLMADDQFNKYFGSSDGTSYRAKLLGGITLLVDKRIPSDAAFTSYNGEIIVYMSKRTKDQITEINLG